MSVMCTRRSWATIPCRDVNMADSGVVLLPSTQLQIQAHGPAPGICEVLFPVLRVDLPEILRYQRLNGLADQVVTVIAEQ